MGKFLIFFFLTGCGMAQRQCTHWTGNLTEKCMRGVVYYQSDSGLALAIDKDGKVVECD